MAIDRENRDKQEIDVVEQVGLDAPDGNVAQQHEAGVLAIDFTGMNTGLDQQSRLAVALESAWRGGPVGCRHHHPDIPPLGTFADGKQMDD